MVETEPQFFLLEKFFTPPGGIVFCQFYYDVLKYNFTGKNNVWGFSRPLALVSELDLEALKSN